MASSYLYAPFFVVSYLFCFVCLLLRYIWLRVDCAVMRIVVSVLFCRVLVNPTYIVDVLWLRFFTHEILHRTGSDYVWSQCSVAILVPSPGESSQLKLLVLTQNLEKVRLPFNCSKYLGSSLRL